MDRDLLLAPDERIVPAGRAATVTNRHVLNPDPGYGRTGSSI
jgi:hypothetical protein